MSMHPLHTVPPLDRNTFVPRGSTALYDAIGRTVEGALGRIETQSDAQKPDTVVVCILTDGFENSSKHYTATRVRQIIESTRARGWNYVFLAANQDAALSAGEMGIASEDTANFEAVPNQAAAGFMCMSAMVSERRSRQ